MQSTYPLLLEEGHAMRQLPLERIASLLASTPAADSGFRSRGRERAGYDADLVLIDLDERFTLRAEDLQQRHKTSPYVAGVPWRRAADDSSWRDDLQDGRITAHSTGRLLRPRPKPDLFSRPSLCHRAGLERPPCQTGDTRCSSRHGARLRSPSDQRHRPDRRSGVHHSLLQRHRDHRRRITAVGPDALLLTARETVDCRGRVVMPGLVNAHTHVPMTLLRGLADDLRLDVWLMGYMMPVEREFVNPDFVGLGTRLGCAEMIRSGITCFADMYYFEDAVANATAEAGMRALCGQTVLRFPAPDAISYEDSLALARDFIERWRGHAADRARAGAARTVHVHAGDPARVCGAGGGVRRAAAHASLPKPRSRSGGLASRSYGMPVIPYVKKQGLFGAKVLAAHCVHVDEGEIRALQQAGAGVAHNPTSNLKLGAGIAPVQRGCWSSASRWASAPTVPRRTTISTCSRRCGWPPCWPRGMAAIRPRCRRARPSRWRRDSARRRCTWTISPDRSNRASAPI